MYSDAHNTSMNRLTDKVLLKNLRHLAVADCYSVRDARIILEARGIQVPSVDSVWRYFKKVRAKRNKHPRG